MSRTRRIFIIKNNRKDSDIYKVAKESFKQNQPRYYLTTGENKESLNDATELGDSGLILLLTYLRDELAEIQDVFIGCEASVISDNKIQYTMKRHLRVENDRRAIDSIVDKIDLDIMNDFTEKTYVIVSDMQSLYEELRDRINSLQLNTEEDNLDRLVEEDSYLSVLAQRDDQVKRAYKEERVMPGRTEFQRDIERIVNSTAFRRMVDKAQIFSAEKGD